MRADSMRKTLKLALAVTLPLAVIVHGAHAQDPEPIRIGLLTVKTGPLATGGIQMEQGLNIYIDEHNSMMAGRPVELIVADTGGSPSAISEKFSSGAKWSSATASMPSSGRWLRSKRWRSTLTSLRFAFRR